MHQSRIQDFTFFAVIIFLLCASAFAGEGPSNRDSWKNLKSGVYGTENKGICGISLERNESTQKLYLTYTSNPFSKNSTCNVAGQTLEFHCNQGFCMNFEGDYQENDLEVLPSGSFLYYQLKRWRDGGVTKSKVYKFNFYTDKACPRS